MNEQISIAFSRPQFTSLASKQHLCTAALLLPVLTMAGLIPLIHMNTKTDKPHVIHGPRVLIVQLIQTSVLKHRGPKHRYALNSVQIQT